jgi:hypothetical protein
VCLFSVGTTSSIEKYPWVSGAGRPVIGTRGWGGHDCETNQLSFVSYSRAGKPNRRLILTRLLIAHAGHKEFRDGKSIMRQRKCCDVFPVEVRQNFVIVFTLFHHLSDINIKFVSVSACLYRPTNQPLCGCYTCRRLPRTLE